MAPKSPKGLCGKSKKKQNISQTPSEQIINVSCCNSSTINCLGKPPPQTICESVFNATQQRSSKRGGGKRQGGGKNSRSCFGGSPHKDQSSGMSEAARIIQCSMLSLWEEQKLCDVLLHASGDDIRAHKMALAAYSDFLVDKFSHFPAGELLTVS